MENLELWNKMATPPADALKKIGGGNLSGFTDINPQWRYKTLTENYGPYGIGWKYTVDKKWSEPGVDGTVMAFVDISLFVHYNRPENMDPYWSDPIPGHGGSMLIVKDRNGLHASDEAYKMATTDALSVACKMLGIGSAVYEGKLDGGNRPAGTKYDNFYDQTPRDDRPRQTPNAAPRSQPPARPPAARPPTRPASQPPAAQQPTQGTVPTTGQINQGLKTGAQVAGTQKPANVAADVINAEQFDTVQRAVVAAKIPLKLWKPWFQAVYGYQSIAEILKSQFEAILKVIKTRPDIILNYGKDPAIKQTPVLPPDGDPGPSDDDLPFN